MRKPNLTQVSKGDFPKIRIPYFGVVILSIQLFTVLSLGSRKPPILGFRGPKVVEG